MSNEQLNGALRKANGSILHILLTSGLLVTVLGALAGGSMWIGRLDQRISDLEKLTADSSQLAQQVNGTDNTRAQQLSIVEERENEMIKHLDEIEAHLAAQDQRIEALELATAITNRGSTIRRPQQ